MLLADVSRSCPAAGGRRVSLPRHRCEELANILPLSAGVANGVPLRVSRSCPASGGRRVSLPRHRCEELANIAPLSLQVLLAGVPLRVSRSCPAAGGRRVSLPSHRCEELPIILPLFAGVARGCATPCVTFLPGSWWPQGEPAQTQVRGAG